MKLENKEGYAFHGENMGDFAGMPNNYKRHKMTVEFILDMVPGAFHDKEDLMRWIMQNPYVATVEVE